MLKSPKKHEEKTEEEKAWKDKWSSKENTCNRKKGKRKDIKHK